MPTQLAAVAPEVEEEPVSVLRNDPKDVAITVSISDDGNVAAFTVVTPDSGVTTDPNQPNTLIASPGNYFLELRIEDLSPYTFRNPALAIQTPFGLLPVAPTGTTTVTLPNSNTLQLDNPQQIFNFYLFVSKSVMTMDGEAVQQQFQIVDPTIVNTPDPA